MFGQLVAELVGLVTQLEDGWDNTCSIFLVAEGTGGGYVFLAYFMLRSTCLL